MIKANSGMFLLIMFKKLSFVLLSILVMISLYVLTAAMKLLLLIPAVPDTVPNVVLNPVKDALLMSALWLLNPNIVISSLPSLLNFASTLSKKRPLLDDLFVVARNTLASLFNDRKYRRQKRLEKKKGIFYHKKSNKSQYLYKDTTDNVIFGAIASLHTFGRPLDWNPHIHVLVCEDAYDSKDDKIKNFSYMDYKKLRQTWRYQLLSYLDRHIGNDKEFQSLKSWFYRKYEEGFYVYAPKIKDEQTKDDIEKCVQYITRYTSRPIMAESRIVNYDDDKKMIHWFYHRHEDNKRVDVTESVYSFLNKVLMHCPEKNFKMVRYFGFYSNKSIKTYNRMAELLSHKQKRVEELKNDRRVMIEKRQKELHFRYNMIKSFQRDPLLCECGETMEYKESYEPFGGNDKNDREYRDRKILKAKYSYEHRKKVNK